ncbi:group XIIA secretory phospholipase A2-like isoform X1 [Clarias gariepinus]|uniref:group XIIA secretory phospholipase A2-like isoform X1 n=2 Tax=Clarias gariepinus TaxID=13013 RepID=UPI00234CA214|nr:group XIIA secretory phospholipase A2-like isoform X1 [Clarias gariepinus]
MKQISLSALLLLATCLSSATPKKSEYKTSDWTETLINIKDGVQNLYTYYTYFKKVKTALDLMLGSDHLCEFKCPGSGQMLFPRPGHNPSSNGCGTPLFVFHFDIKIPATTRCCNQHDYCYDTCGRKKRECDEQFQICLKNICGNLLKALGLDQNDACDLLVSHVFDGVMHLGCKPYLDSQKAACVCKDKAKL